MSTPQLVSLEFIVPDLAPPLVFFGDVLGLPILGPTRHSVLDAEVAQVVAGAIVITLLCPTDTGSGTPHSSPDSRLSQLNFTLPQAELGETRARLETAGAAVIERDDLFYVDPDMIKGVLGVDAAVVFAPDESAAGVGET